MTAAPRPIRVLEPRAGRGNGGGPEKTILLGAARADPRRFAITVCYLRDARDPRFAIGARAARLGLDYVEVREEHPFDPSIFTRVRALVRERRIEIVHAHEYKTDLLALLLARAERVTPLATVHGWTGHTAKERLYYAVDKRLLAWFPLVIAVSSEIRRVLLRAGARPSRIRTIPNAIDPADFRRDRAREAAVREALGVAPGEVVIGSVGRLARQKRFDLLLDALAIARRARPDLRLAIAGEGKERASLEARAARLGLAGAVRLLGHRPDVAEVHHALDVFVQSSDYEGTSNAVLEAMALETPLVATRAGGTADLVADGVHGLLVPCGDAGAIASAIERTLADREATARRVSAARARVEGELSFEARRAALEAIYEELAARRPEPVHA
jgi:glycosyltransferase involved in cell wall biosynthesis